MPQKKKKKSQRGVAILNKSKGNTVLRRRCLHTTWIKVWRRWKSMASGRIALQEQLVQALWGRTVLRMFNEQHRSGYGRSRVSVESRSVSCIPAVTNDHKLVAWNNRNWLALLKVRSLKSWRWQLWERTCSSPLPAPGGHQHPLISITLLFSLLPWPR